MNDQLDRPLRASEWVPDEDAATRSTAWRLIWAVPSVLAGVPFGLAWGPLPGIVAAGTAAVALYLWTRVQGWLALRSVAATRVAPGSELRLRNLVEGLAGATGSIVPELWLIPEGGPNALVCDTGRRPAIAVTRTLLDSYTRTELEGVLAHCLVRLPPSAKLSQAVALGPLGLRTTRVGFSDDAAAAAITRYPPALVEAVVKAHPRADRFDVFWFVGLERSHEPQSARAKRLLDL
jgi:hypothetical protein